MLCPAFLKVLTQILNSIGGRLQQRVALGFIMFKLLIEDSRLVDFAQGGFERGVFLLDLLV